MNSSTVSLKPEVLTHNAFTGHVRDRLDDVDLTKGEVVERHANYDLVSVRFPVKREHAWRSNDLTIDLGIEDLIITTTKVEVDCYECDGACYVENVAFCGLMETGMAVCGTCEGKGYVLQEEVPYQNILPVEALAASNELPF